MKKSTVLTLKRGTAVIIPTTESGKWDLHLNNTYSGRFDRKQDAISHAKKVLKGER